MPVALVDVKLVCPKTIDAACPFVTGSSLNSAIPLPHTVWGPPPQLAGAAASRATTRPGSLRRKVVNRAQ